MVSGGVRYGLGSWLWSVSGVKAQSLQSDELGLFHSDGSQMYALGLVK